MNKTMTKAEKKAAYDAWYLAEIDKGLEDIEAGRVLTDEQAEAEMRIHMAKLHEKYGQKAA
jgi:predicted transcriptional regulator